jgi:GT2 family glycosyltransferase
VPLRHIFVIDNDQSDHCRHALAPVWPHVEYIQTTSNLGYSGGMNRGIRSALDRGASGVLIANSDTVIPPGCVGELCDVLDSVPDAGIAGPMVVARDRPDRIASLGLSYQTTTGRMRHLFFDRPRATVPVSRAQVVDAVSGCLMLVQRRVFERAGLFEEAYFFGFEELDLCLKARQPGLRTVLAGHALVYHKGGGSLDSRSPRRHYFAARNHLLLASRVSPSSGRAARVARSASIILLNLAYAIRCGPRLLPARLGAVARGVRDYRLGRYGPDR